MTAVHPGGPRVVPLAPKQWPREMREALEALGVKEPRHPIPAAKPGRPKALNLFGLMAYHPALSRAYNTLNAQLMYGTSLSERQRELLILRATWLRNAAYEHKQHVIVALDVGLTAEDIERVRFGPDAPEWSAAEQALLSAVDELLEDGTVGDRTWAALSDDLETQQLVDLVFTVGSWTMLATFTRTFGLQMDDDLRNWTPDQG